MKTKITTTLAAIFIAFNGTSQITLEHSYVSPDETISMVNLSVSGHKYYSVNTTTHQLKIYNLNHTLWKTINLPIPTGTNLLFPSNISEKLFNLDNTIELSYMYYIPSNPVVYTTKIIDEFGTELMTIDNCNSLYPYNTVENGWKLFANIINGTISHTNVYNIIGTGTSNSPTDGNGTTGILSNEASSVKIASPFPNPSQTQITIPYSLPQNSEGVIHIFDQNGNEIQNHRIDSNFSNVLLDISSFSSGAYRYEIVGSNSQPQTSSFIVE